MAEPPRKLHLGCGRTILPGWINLDSYPGAGVDVVADLDACATTPLPFATDSIDEILGSHLLEHLHRPLPLMQELHRVARAGCKAVFRTPYGSSDDAWEDPTHVRPYFLQSYGYFSQPYYWRADYGYRGDWQAERITLRLPRKLFDGKSREESLREVMSQRNMVKEMIAELRAIKPIREPRKDLQKMPPIQLVLV